MRSDQNNSLWTTPTRPEHIKRPDSGHPLTVQSTLSVKNLDSLSAHFSAKLGRFKIAPTLFYAVGKNTYFVF